MGMYTELKFHAKLHQETPQSVIDVLKWLVDGKKKIPPTLPNHQFFLCERAAIVFVGGSSSFDWNPPTLTQLDDGWELSVHSSIKNYDSEYEHFIDWINPYVCHGLLDVHGLFAITQYEDSEETIEYVKYKE